MCSWQAQGPYLAMATERGQCIVWHFPSKEIIKELGSVPGNSRVAAEDDDSSDTSFTFSSEACVRLVKFNPVPLFNYSKTTAFPVFNFTRANHALSAGVRWSQEERARSWHEDVGGTNHQGYVGDSVSYRSHESTNPS